MSEFISPEHYRYVYLAIVSILVIIATIDKDSYNTNCTNNLHITVAVGIFFIIFFGTRPTYSEYMADTLGYVKSYQALEYGIKSYDTTWETGNEIIWKSIAMTMSTMHIPAVYWLTIVAAIYIFFNIAGIKRLFPNNVYLVFLFYIAFFLFYSGGINGIRNADAYSIIFFAITFYNNPSIRNYIIMALLGIIAYQIHSSVIITIVSFIASITFIKKPKLALLIWVGAIFISVAAGNSLANLVSGFANDDRAEKYLNLANNSRMTNGFRWDFLIFSALPIFIGWKYVIKRKIADRMYLMLFNTYVIANAFWIIFIYAAFSNRFAMLSWCIYPYLLCYPLLKFRIWSKSKQTLITYSLLCVQLLFTFYMTL